MRYYLLVAILVLSSMQASHAQDISGSVLNEQTRNPLKNVLVTNLNTGSSMLTANDGSFSFKNVQFPIDLEFKKSDYKILIESFNDDRKETNVYLERDVQQLSEVLIRSSNIPQSVRKIAASVSLISEGDLQRTDNFNLVQNFNYVPGVYVGQGALNTNKINIRGIGSRAQFSTNRIKAYINGIPLTTAEGDLTLDDFDGDYLDRVEIIKGPVSSVYGAGLGGAINLYTKKVPENSRSFTVNYGYGSFNTQKTGANFTYAQDSLDINLNYNQVQGNGYRQNGEYDRISILGSTGLLNKKGNYWSFFFSYSNLKAFIPSSLNAEDFKNEPQKAAFTWNQAAGYESYDKNIFGLSYEHSFNENFKNQTVLFYSSRDGYEPRPFNILDDDRNSVGARTRFNYNAQVLGKKSEFSFGAETMLESYETGTFENLYQEAEERRSVQGERLSLNAQDRNYLNFFAQVNSQLSSRLMLEAGFNFNSTSYELEDKFNTGDLDQSGNYRFDPIFSPRLGLNYEAFEGKNFYLSAGHGFSTPTVAQTLTPEGNINTDLRTETGWNYELGFKGNWFRNKLYTELNLYTIQIRDLLVARRVGPDQFVGVNAGKADHNGIEFTSAYQEEIFKNLQLRLFLNSSFNFFVFDKFVDLGENYSGNTLPGVPEYMVSPGIDISFNDISANFNYQAFGRMALDDGNTGYTDPYQLLNLKLDYDWIISPGLQFRFNFGINNLLDEKYAASIVTNAVGFGGSAPRYYYPGNPRNFFGGVRARFDL